MDKAKNIGNKVFNCVSNPKVVWDSRSANTLGYYNPTTNSIHLDEELLEEHGIVYIKEVVLHEYAHAIQREIYGSYVKPHGREFKLICSYLDTCSRASTKAFMKSKTLNQRKRKTRKWEYVCNCNKSHFLSTTMHNKIQRGATKRFCKTCGATIKYK